MEGSRVGGASFLISLAGSEAGTPRLVLRHKVGLCFLFALPLNSYLSKASIKAPP